MITEFNKTAVLLILALSVLAQCTKKAEKSKLVVDLEKNFQAAQEELSKYDAKIKAAAGDEGLTIQYNYDKELAKSRVDRLKEQLRVLSPESVLEAPTEAGGHGGGH